MLTVSELSVHLNTGHKVYNFACSSDLSSSGTLMFFSQLLAIFISACWQETNNILQPQKYICKNVDSYILNILTDVNINRRM